MNTRVIWEALFLGFVAVFSVWGMHEAVDAIELIWQGVVHLVNTDPWDL